MNEETLHEKLEKYVRGQLSLEAAHALEQDIAKDPDLREQLWLHRLELESHEYLLRENLRQHVREWITDAPPLPDLNEPPVLVWKKPILILSLLVAIVVAGWLFFRETPSPVLPGVPTPPVEGEKQPNPAAPNDGPPAHIAEQPNQTSAPDQALAQYAALEFGREEENQENSMRNDAGQVLDTSLLGRAERAFAATHYIEAVSMLKKISPSEDTYEAAQELMGRAYFHQKKFADAAGIFESMLKQDYIPETRQRAEWYLLLSLVQDYSRNKTQADGLLKKILNPAKKHGYQQNAKKLEVVIRK